MTRGDGFGDLGPLDFDDLDDFFARPRAPRSASASRTQGAQRSQRAQRARTAPRSQRSRPASRSAASRRTAARPAVRTAGPSATGTRGRATATSATVALSTRPDGRPAGPRPAATRAASTRVERNPRPSRSPRQRAAPRPLDPSQVARRTRKRLAGFVAVVAVLCVGITVRLATVQLGGGSTCRTASVADCREYGADQRHAFRPLPAGRGGIFDRDGHAFALSVPEPDVVADPASIEDPEAAAAALAPLLDLDESDLRAQLSTAGSRYQLLAPTVTKAVEKDVRDLDIAGITFEDTYVRHNPSDDLARAVIGQTYADGRVDEQQRQGQTGLELAYDRELKGTPGKLTFEKDPSGGTIAGTREKLEAAVPGTDLYLTLDQTLQYAAEQAIADQVRDTGAKQGMAVISRPSTGEIVAMVSVAADEDGDVANTGDNKPVSSVFEPGSVNKMITIAGAMEEGLVDPDTSMAVPDHVQVADHRFTDHDPHAVEQWSTTDILVTSSNVGTIKIAQQLGEAKVDEYLHRFGFGEATSTDFPGEVRGLMLPLDDWSGTSIGAIPIGQGISVTALQMLAAYNVIANDGVYVSPKLVSSTDKGKGQRATAPSKRRRVVSAETAQAMSGMLQKVVSEGTGTPAQIPGYPVAGKTGTARIPQPGPHADPGNAYQDAQGRYHYESSFVGFVPGADLSVIVTIQDAQTSIYGSEVAAPVFASLASLALRNGHIAPPALIAGAAAAVPDLSATAKEIDGEDPGLVTQTSQG